MFIFKQVAFALIPLLILSLLVELAFYAKIGDQCYKANFQNAINYLSKSDEPERDLAWWEDNSITIRNSQLVSKLQVLFGKNDNLRSISIKPSDISNGDKDRVFIVGCSAAYGYGVRFDSTFGFLLEKRIGGAKKIINAGQVGWSSIQLVPVIKRIVDSYSPQTVILFLGNNEWKNWSHLKPSSGEIVFWKLLSFCSHSHALSYIMYQTLVHRNKTGTHEALNMTRYHAYNYDYLEGYKYALANPISNYTDFDFEEWTKTKQKYIRNYRNNLLEMVSYCKKKGVGIILMTLPFNYKLSSSWASPQPIYRYKKNRDTINGLVKEVDTNIDNNHFGLAEAHIDQAIAIEPEISTLHYMRGYILEKTGRHLEAEEAYSLSKEYMVGDKGSILSIDSCIRGVAKSTNTDLIDVKKIFDEYEHSKGQYYNDSLIFDDCHPNELGHEIIANSLFNFFYKK